MGGKPRGVGNEGKRRIFIAERAKGRTIKEAAAKADLSEGQGERLSADPQIRARVDRLLAEMSEEDRRARLEARRDAQTAARFALRRLIDLAQGSGKDAVQAGKALLEHDRQLWPTQIDVEVSAPSPVEGLQLRDIFVMEDDEDEAVVIDMMRDRLREVTAQEIESREEPRRLRVVESNGSRPPAKPRPDDGLTDGQRALLVRYHLYFEGSSPQEHRDRLPDALEHERQEQQRRGRVSGVGPVDPGPPIGDDLTEADRDLMRAKGLYDPDAPPEVQQERLEQARQMEGRARQRRAGGRR